MKSSLWAVAAFILLCIFTKTSLAATAVPFTVNMSEAVVVNTAGGTPRIAVDVGGVTRYATYTSGSGTAALTFTYTTQAGDLDLDGIAVSSPLQLDGGTITDAAGNALSPLTFTVPATSGLRVDHPSLSLDFTSNDYILSGTHYNSLTSFLTAAGGTFSRASIGTYFDNAGVMQTAASGAPRLDHDPVTHAARGVLIEEARTNILERSTDMKTARWTGYCGAWINGSSGVADPAGGTNAVRIPASSDACGAGYASGIIQCYESTCTTGSMAAGTYTVSFWGRTESGTLSVGVGTDDVNSGSATCTLTTTWQRCVKTVTKTIVSNYNDRRIIQIIEATQNNPAYQIFAPQLEAGSFATSYIPTAATAVTRAADVLTIPTGAWFNAPAGTANVEAQFFGNASVVGGVFALNDGNGLNRVDARAGQSQSIISAAGANTILSPTAFSGITKIAMAYSATVASLSRNGATPLTGTPRVPAGVTTLWIGNIDGGGYWLNGYVRKFRYYPSAAANSQLQLVTQ